jgi:hypothetical protein
MRISIKKSASFLLGFALIAYFAVAFFGMSQAMMGMEKQNGGTMSGCIFSGKAEICPMNFSEHLARWQGMFTTTVPQKALAITLLILLAVVFVAVAILKRNLFLLFNHRATGWRLYINQNPHLSLFDHLKEAFSQGILSPKLYA